jgi:hypothetical protein
MLFVKAIGQSTLHPAIRFRAARMTGASPRFDTSCVCRPANDARSHT